MARHIIYLYISVLLALMSISLQAQSISSKEDRKLRLLQDIKPPNSLSKPIQIGKRTKGKESTYDSLTTVHRIKKTGGAEFDDGYNTKALEQTFLMQDLLKVDSLCEVKTVITGGKLHLSPIKETDKQHDKISQKHRLVGSKIDLVIGGLNLSFWKKKKVSKKSKRILRDTYGIEVDD